jgi:hypothetical protein
MITKLSTSRLTRLSAWHWLLALLIVLGLNMTPLAPAAYAFPAEVEANINGTDCLLVDAITAANTDTATGACAAGNSGADTITLLTDITLTAADNDEFDGVGLPVIISPITIEGGGHTIARDAGAPDFRILYVNDDGALTLNNATISGGNSSTYAGGGILNRGMLILNNSTISGNTAPASGGLHNNVGTATLINSTVSGNTASNAAGGIFNDLVATLTLINSTVSGNTASNAGGGIHNQGTLTLINSTVSGNSATTGGGIYNRVASLDPFLPGTVNLQRSLISGNSAANGPEIYNQSITECHFDPLTDELICNNLTGTVISADFNLIGHDGNAGTQNFTPSGSDIVPSQPLSAILDVTLANNGGPTLTHALVTGSPAVDAAPSGPATDQRGVARPQGSAFDIGAFELEAGDATAPTINIATPADGATYTLGQTANASYSCADEAGGSGLASCAGTVPSGSPLDTSSVGAKSFTVHAADNAGNTSTLTHNYSVVFSTSFGNNFGAPVDAPPMLNLMKAGGSVPVKFKLGGNYGLNILASGYPTSRQITCDTSAPVDLVEETTTSNSGLTYDPASGQYTYVWKTQKSWAGTCRQFTLRLTDGSDHIALFQFK